VLENRMRVTEMPQQMERGSAVPMTTTDWQVRALRLLCVLAIGMTLAACGRCGDFLSSSQSQIDACHSDPPPQP
jgi:hypothetical protein